MATYYNESGKYNWKELPDDEDLEQFGYVKLRENEGMDNDNGWHDFVEFWRDGVRTYSFVHYACWSNYYESYGEMESMPVYGTLEELKADRFSEVSQNGYCLIYPHKFDPHRDWIVV